MPELWPSEMEPNLQAEPSPPWVSFDVICHGLDPQEVTAVTGLTPTRIGDGAHSLVSSSLVCAHQPAAGPSPRHRTENARSTNNSATCSTS